MRSLLSLARRDDPKATFSALAYPSTLAEVTRKHPEGIKGAQATALAIFLARTGSSKNDVKQEIATRFGYELNISLDAIRPHYSFDVSCQGSVPEAIISFLESTDYESAVRNAVSLGGDSDTLACIAGGIAQAYYNGIPKRILNETIDFLPDDLLAITEEFNKTFSVSTLDAGLMRSDV